MAREGHPKYLSRPSAGQVAARRDGWLAAKALAAAVAVERLLDELERVGPDRRLSASTLAVKTAVRHLRDAIPREDA